MAQEIAMQQTSRRIPTHSKGLWGLLIILLSLVMIATMYKDWWLTGEQPSLLFYLLVPIMDILSTSLVMFLTARVFKESIPFPVVLVISLGAVIVLQILENVEKLIWYRIWQYPGILYLVFNLGLYSVVVTYSLKRWTGIRWWLAVVMAFIGLLGSLIMSGIFLSLTGINTPGS